MKLLTLTLFLANIFATAAFADSHCPGPGDCGATAIFTQLKTLEGTWETPSGEPFVYEVTSNGTALVERSGGMMSVFAVDGDSVLMTHYCSAGNQPRLRAIALAADGSVTFTLVDVGNQIPGDGFISGATFQFLDAGHMLQKWTYRENGADHLMEFQLTRK